MDDLFETLGYNPKAFKEDLKENICCKNPDLSVGDAVDYISKKLSCFQEETKKFIRCFAKDYWEKEIDHIKDTDPRCFEFIAKASQWRPRNYSSILVEFMDYFRGLCSFTHLVLEVKPEDNIPEGAIIDKVSLIKERNKDALKSIVHDPRYDMEVTSDNVMESFSDLVDVLNALDETRDCMCKVCEEAKALCASGEVFSKKCIIDALKIASITYVTFFGKIVKKIIDVPCDFGDACEEAKEELAPKRVF